ncbi:MAG: hypothetical protein ACIARR_06500 [Phycisphaerales bacterium JB059]
MTRAQRRAHLLFWLLIAPLAIGGVALLIANAPGPTRIAEDAP